MSDSPKVSVIIPTYNRAALLPRAVNSVLAQTCQDFEILIVDDGSADDTPAVIAGFADARVRSFRHDANRGQSAAINTGLANARGEYITPLDDDSVFTPESLAGRLAALEAAPPNTALVYGWMDVVDHATGEPVTGHRLELESVEFFEHVLTTRGDIGTSNLFLRTSIAREVGGYDERLTFGNDQYFIMNILLRYRVIVLQEVVMQTYKGHGYPAMSDYHEMNNIQRETFYDIFITRFSTQLEQRQKRFASVLLLRSVNAMECRLVATSLRSFLGALKRRPLTPTNIRYALRLARIFLFYATPLSRLREPLKTLQRRLRLRKT